MSASDSLMPGPEGKTPRFYEVDRGQKTESYITAVSGNPVAPGPSGTLGSSSTKKKPIKYKKVDDEVVVLTDDEPTSRPKPDGQIGLTEDELLQFRDDGFWRTIRLFLFILFWILWLLMFIVAIIIVILSPSCTVREKPHWWQTSVAYHVWVPSFQDSDSDGVGDVNGLISRLDKLRKSGVQVVWPTPFLLSDDFGPAVRNFNQMESKIGANQDADKLIDAVHELGMKIVITVPIASTSQEHEWFLASSTASIPENKNYSEFYHWTDNPTSSEFYSNYKSLNFLHIKSNPKAAVLNWKLKDVRQHMFDVLSKWMERGVDGFYLSEIEYLARSDDGTEANWQGVSKIIREIRTHVDTYSTESVVLKDQNKKIALFASREEAKEKDKLLLASSGLNTIINYEFGRIEKDSDICHRTEGTVATCVHEILSDVLLFHSNHEEVWPQWEFGNPYVSRVATRVGSRIHAELLSMLQLVLPGTNNVYYGEELGMRDLRNDSLVPPHRGVMQWDSSMNAGFSTKESTASLLPPDYENVNWELQNGEEKSHLKMFSKLAKLRQRDETLSIGKTLVGRLVDGAFTVTRFLQENNTTIGNIYVAAVNFSPNTISIPLVDLPQHINLGKSQIVTVTSNVRSLSAREPVDYSSKSISLNPEEGVVFKYPA
ncbi:unnamed protein product [Auanema sp. JU1783]|nr:unnamed protein product [Auanema sp. JU1783]